MICDVCDAPALPMNGACVFCRSPLTTTGAPEELIDYLADRVPGAQTRRSGLLRRGPVTQLTVSPGGQTHAIRLAKSGVRLQPDLEPAAWADSLIRSLSSQAASDPELRTAISRAGWDPR